MQRLILNIHYSLEYFYVVTIFYISLFSCSTLQYCCGNFVTAILPIVVAVFIVSTMLCLAFLLIGISGMKKEISLLKINLNYGNYSKCFTSHFPAGN